MYPALTTPRPCFLCGKLTTVLYGDKRPVCEFPCWTIYTSYRSMKDRCENPNHSNYPAYGGRGIFICPEWSSNIHSFYAWVVSQGYKPGDTIDRINNNLGYSPGNCKLSTRKEQVYNRAIMLEYQASSMFWVLI